MLLSKSVQRNISRHHITGYRYHTKYIKMESKLDVSFFFFLESKYSVAWILVLLFAVSETLLVAWPFVADQVTAMCSLSILNCLGLIPNIATLCCLGLNSEP